MTTPELAPASLQEPNPDIRLLPDQLTGSFETVFTPWLETLEVQDADHLLSPVEIIWCGARTDPLIYPQPNGIVHYRILENEPFQFAEFSMPHPAFAIKKYILYDERTKKAVDLTSHAFGPLLLTRRPYKTFTDWDSACGFFSTVHMPHETVQPVQFTDLWQTQQQRLRGLEVVYPLHEIIHLVQRKGLMNSFNPKTEKPYSLDIPTRLLHVFMERTNWPALMAVMQKLHTDGVEVLRDVTVDTIRDIALTDLKGKQLSDPNPKKLPYDTTNLFPTL